MRRKKFILFGIIAAILLISSGTMAQDRVRHKVTTPAGASGAVFPKVEIHISSHSKTEALAVDRRIQVDIGKVEGELSGTGRGRTWGPGNLPGYTESLLREVVKLSRLHQKEGLQEGSSRYSGPMKEDAERLHSLALSLNNRQAGGGRVHEEMKSLVGRLRSQVSAHDMWVRGLQVGSGPDTGAGQTGKPVPANRELSHGKWIDTPRGPGMGIRAPGAVPGQDRPGATVYPKVEVKGSQTGFDGVDGESQGELRAPAGNAVIPKLELDGKGGQTGYDGVDGESLGR